MANPKYTPFIYTSQAIVVICNKTFVAEHEISATLIRVDDYSSFAKLLDLYTKQQQPKNLKFREKLILVEKLKLANKYVEILYQLPKGMCGKQYNNTLNVTIYPGVQIGENCLIYAGVRFDNCIIGNNCILQPEQL